MIILHERYSGDSATGVIKVGESAIPYIYTPSTSNIMIPKSFHKELASSLPIIKSQIEKTYSGDLNFMEGP